MGSMGVGAGVQTSMVVPSIEIHARRRVGDMTFAGVIGRVGALAVALGVGSAIASMPMAFADTTGSAGSSASDSSVKAPARVARSAGVARSGGASAAKPRSAAAGLAAPRAAAAGSVNAPRGTLVAWLGAGKSNNGGPAAEPVAWTVAAASRRELGGAARTARAAFEIPVGVAFGPLVPVAARAQSSRSRAVVADEGIVVAVRERLALIGAHALQIA